MTLDTWLYALALIALLGGAAGLAYWRRRSVLRSTTDPSLLIKVLNNMTQAVIMADNDGRIVFFNDRYIDMYRLSREVVKPGAQELSSHLRKEGCEVVVCMNAAEGMGASLACAARAAGKANGYLVALADMPFVRPSSIAAIRDAIAGGAPLAAPYFRARRGHPVGISGAFFDELLALQGDEGARQLLARNDSRLRKVPVGDPGVIRDIDTPGDLLPPLSV